MASPPASTDQAAGQAADPTNEPDHTLVGEGSWSALAAWAADELGVHLAFDGKLYRIEDAEPEDGDDRDAANAHPRRSWFRRRRGKSGKPEEDPTESEPFTTEAPADILLELIDRLRERPSPPFARPIEQPTAVHDFTDRLFGAYQLDGGQAHLAGCHLEDVPLVRLTTVEDSGDTSATVSHRYFDELGTPIEIGQVEALGIDRVAPMEEPRPRIDMGRLERMLESARRAARDDEPALATIVWAKHATGRLRFEFGEESLDLEFDGWASQLVAPPIICPQTDIETFHLAADDEGVIAAADAIVPSVVTGRRRLAKELTECRATGKLAEAEHFGVSAATGDAVLKSELVTCGRCGLLIAPTEKQAGDCAACRAAKSVDLSDERWKEILAAHPGLAGPKWRATQIAGALLLETSGWLRRRFVTLNDETLAVTHAAEAGRFSSAWRSLSKGTYD